MDVTATFLSGAILSWALPVALLIAVTFWWVVVLRRRSSGTDS
jgi:cytochrome c-type biogenesis protein CcmH/NrfF